MNAPRLFVSFVILCAWLAAPPPAATHRLDEYLQATRLSIDIDRVDLEIDLTAGSAMASQVFAWIDTNRDGEISNAEGEVYAREMLGAVTLKIDGHPVPVNLLSAAYPQFREMSLGVGTIRLRATAKLPPASAGRHQVSFVNTHRTESSVYLVNALVPANPRIQLAGQRRDRAQLSLTLDYSVTGDAPSASTFMLLTGLLIAACLFLRWGHPIARRHGAPGPT